MKKANPFIKRPVTSVSIAIVTALIGCIALFSLPIQQYPDIAPPTVRVTTTYTGADAEAVQQSVLVPLEESINGVEDMIYMTSTANSSGQATISVYFRQGTDPDMAAVNVQNRVQKALGLLPAEVTRVGVTTEKRQSSNMQIVSVMCDNGRYDETFIANWLDINLFPQIKRIPGVSNVTMNSETSSLRIWLKPDVMGQYGLTPKDISAALDGQNLVSPAGLLGENSKNTYQYTLKYKGRLKDLEEFRNIVIRSNGDGNVLRLRDVADVELGPLSYAYQTFVNGNPGVNFVINPMPDVNTAEINEQILALYEEVEETMPEGIELICFLNTNEFLYASIYSVVETLIVAVILVILVIYFFLHDLKSTLIPTIALAVSILGTFAVLKIAGYSINILTLFALVLAIGSVVDDAIIVVEAIQSRFEQGCKSAYTATRDAMNDVTPAVISCTLVFMVVFIPVMFMNGTSGIFYAQFGLTMAAAVGLSCVCALTLTPALSALLFRPAEGTPGTRSFNARIKMAYSVSFNYTLGKYKRAVMFCMRRRWIIWSSLAVSVILLAYLMNTTRTGLVPQEDKGLIYISVSTTPGNTLEETAQIMEQVEKIAWEQPETNVVARIDGNGVMSGLGSCYGTFYIRLKDWSERPDKEQHIDAVIARLDAACRQIPGANIFVLQEAMIPGYGQGNAVELHLQDRTGGEMADFYNISQGFLDALRERPEIGTAFSSFALDFPQYSLSVDAAQCLRSGVDPEDVLSTLGSYFGGDYASNFNQFGKIYRVMVQAAPSYRIDESSLARTFVKVGNGKMAPLSQFVHLKPESGSQILTRFNLYGSISASISPNQGFSNSQVMDAIAETASKTLPAGYGYEYGGISREEAQESGSGSAALTYLLCAVLVYFILASLYESFLVPLAVMLSIPFGLTGAFLSTRAFGMENNIYLQIGVIMLIGLLAKTAILITEYAAERRRRGLGIVRSAYQASIVRFRPIMMTVMSMVIGLLPLVFASSVGANGTRVLGTGAVGGLIVGTLALLFVTPVFYIAFQTLQEKIRPVSFRNSQDGGETSTDE